MGFPLKKQYIMTAKFTQQPHKNTTMQKSFFFLPCYVNVGDICSGIVYITTNHSGWVLRNDIITDPVSSVFVLKNVGVHIFLY